MKTMEKKSVFLKGTQSALAPCWPGHEFSYFEKSSPQPEVKVYQEFHISLLLHFQSLTEKPVFECAFAHPIMLFLS